MKARSIEVSPSFKREHVFHALEISYLLHFFLQILDMCLSNLNLSSMVTKRASNWDDSDVAAEDRLGVGFSHNDGLVLRAVSFQTIFIVPFVNRNKV